MKIKKQLAKFDPVYSCPGSEFTDDYAYEYHKDGTKDLIIVGHTNLQEKIQSWKDYTSLKLMLARFEQGDENALNRVKGMYADMTDMPKTYAEMVERVESCREAFNGLDPDIKEKFGNNSDVFWSLFGTAEFVERIGSKAEKIMDTVEKEVINNGE